MATDAGKPPPPWSGRNQPSGRRKSDGPGSRQRRGLPSSSSSAARARISRQIPSSAKAKSAYIPFPFPRAGKSSGRSLSSESPTPFLFFPAQNFTTPLSPIQSNPRSARWRCRPDMEKPDGGSSWAWSAVVLLLGLAAFSCSTAAEFYRAKVKDMKLDGNLCSMPRTAAFGLGVAALVCLSVAQVLATTAVAIRLRRSKGEKSSRSGQLVADRRRRPALTIALLVLSWVSFGLGTVLLSTGTSMNGGQRYGQGWMDGKCYVVRAGVYLGSAALVALTACLLVVVLLRRPILSVVFGGEGMMTTMTAPPSRHHRRTGPASDEVPRQLK